jgi:transposase
VDTLELGVTSPERVRCHDAHNSSPYPPEFKAEAPKALPLVAVRFYKESGRSLYPSGHRQEIASDTLAGTGLGVSSNSLRDWVKRSKVGRNDGAALSQDEREELKRLRRENRILREEREILKIPIGHTKPPPSLLRRPAGAGSRVQVY